MQGSLLWVAPKLCAHKSYGACPYLDPTNPGCFRRSSPTRRASVSVLKQLEDLLEGELEHGMCAARTLLCARFTAGILSFVEMIMADFLQRTDATELDPQTLRYLKV